MEARGGSERYFMIDQLQKDQAARADLFRFFGAIRPEKLDSWLRERKLDIPQDLKTFWCETGGGDLFESETVLSPFGNVDLGDDIDSVNQGRWQKGMPAHWLAFHTGLGLSVVETLSGGYANLHGDSYEVRSTFKSLDDWYSNFLRKEYAERYGLR
ncbi:MAG TPA: hypothetical protein VGM18_18275 [Candidatus Sulfotelmatobacter sp.]|jgi:hypothetical protein